MNCKILKLRSKETNMSRGRWLKYDTIMILKFKCLAKVHEELQNTHTHTIKSNNSYVSLVLI